LGGGTPYTLLQEPLGGGIGVENSSLALGDIDNDGLLDMVVSGSDGTNKRFILYKNQGGGSPFVELEQPMGSTEGVEYGALALADIDEDGDLDLAFSGMDSTNEHFKILFSEYALIEENDPPAAPTVFEAEYKAGKINFLWGDGSDVESSDQDSLYYSIRVATNSMAGLAEDAQPNPSLIPGSYGTPLLGTYLRPNTTTQDLSHMVVLGGTNAVTLGTTYYWQVKTIDSGLDTSDWSLERIFATPPAEIYPNAKGGSDTSASALANIQTDDNVLYTVSQGDTMYFVTFDTSTVGTLGALTTINLEFEYSVDAGYDGTNSVEVSTDNGTNWTLIVQPQSGDQNVVVSTDLVNFGVTVLADVANLDIRFFNSDSAAADSVFFDYIFVYVSDVDDLSPDPITDLVASTTTNSGEVVLNWTATGDDELFGSIIGGQYHIDYSTDSSTLFDNTTWQVQIGTNTNPGNAQTYTLTGLTVDNTYFFRIFTADEVPNWSDLSNGTSVYVSSPAAQPEPGSPSISTVFVTSMTMNWTSVSSEQGYVVEASTKSDFFPIFSTTETTNGAATSLTVLSLNANTTYYLQVGSRWTDGTTSYASALTKATLANVPLTPSFTDIFTSSITATWTIPGGGAQGYLLELSTASDFTGTIESSQTFDGSVSTLTVLSLSAGTTYYGRVGSLNHDNVFNYASFGSTKTLGTSQPAPGAHTITGVSASTLTLTWTQVSSEQGYLLEASTDNSFNGLVHSTSTPNGSATTLTISTPTLTPFTTYYLKVGSLWTDGTTTYTSNLSTTTPEGWGQVWAGTTETSDETSSLTWGDFDNDGDLDLAAANGNVSGRANRIYENVGGGNFNLVWSSPEADLSYYMDWGDFDNDGDLDLAVANSEPSKPNRVYRNDGGATFVQAWTTPEFEFSGSMVWGDYDNDGNVDLLVGNWDIAKPNRVYRNDGSTFTLVWSAGEVSDYTPFAAWGDYDNDGDLDFAVANDHSARPNRIYRNDDGIFTLAVSLTGEISDETRIVAWADVDNDGDLDLGVGNWNTSNRVYRNDGGDTFALLWSAPETTDQTCGIAWADYDNDGFMDLASSNFSTTEPNRVYRNTGGGSFSLAWSAPETSDNTALLAWGDYDNDGILDLAVTNFSASLPNRIYKGHFQNTNTTPNPPSTGLSITFSTGRLNIEWDDGTDAADSADPDSLYYKLFVATAPMASNPSSVIVSSQIGTPLLGRYLRPRDPALSPPNRVFLTGFEELQQNNTYYFSVATIDAGLAMSAWSVETSTYVAGDGAAPDPITDLGAVTGGNLNEVDLTWTSTGDDGASGLFSGNFKIHHTTTLADAQNVAFWSTAAAQVTVSTVGASPGTIFNFTVDTLEISATSYYFRIFAQDEALNTSALSNGATAQTLPDLERYWVASGITVWTSTEAWATSSNGTPGASFPNANQAVFLDGAGSKNGQVFVNTPITVATLTINGFTGIFDTHGHDITVTNSFSQASGSVVLGSSIFTANGDLTHSGGVFNSGTSIVKFEGTNNQTLTSGASDFYSLEINKGAGTVSLGDALVLDGDLTITAGTLDTSVSNYPINVAGNWTNTGIFLERNGTITFDPLAGSSSTLTGSTTFYTLRALNSGTTLFFEANTTFFVTNEVDFQNIGLRSTNDGTQWNFKYTGSSQTLKTVDVKDSNASLGLSMDADTTSTDSGNNVNWNFNPAPGSPSVTSVFVSSITVTWISTNSEQGYLVEASTESDFSGIIHSTSTTDGTATTLTISTPALTPNTAYSIRVGSLWNDGTTSYTGTLSTTTLEGWAVVWSAPTTDDFTQSVSWGDFDNDGDLDLAVANWTGTQNNHVYRNDGGGVFTVVWVAAETGEESGSITWGDYDNDGDLDLAVGNTSSSKPNRVYRNNGDETFSPVWSGTGETLDQTEYISWGDFDNDGDLDLGVGNDSAPNRVYRNEGGGILSALRGPPMRPTPPRGLDGVIMTTMGIWIWRWVTTKPPTRSIRMMGEETFL